MQSNFTICRLGERQVNSLAKILEYSEDETLVEEKQITLKRGCMELWDVPIGARRGPSYDQPDQLCRALLSNSTSKQTVNLFPSSFLHEKNYYLCTVYMLQIS